MGDEALSVTGVYGGLPRGMARWCAISVDGRRRQIGHSCAK
jgi:hypothetical protein